MYNDRKMVRGQDMLFRKRIKYCCSYCANGTQVDDEQVLCIKRGVVCAYSKCRKFIYDPCKRIPPKPKALDFNQYNKDDYSL